MRNLPYNLYICTSQYCDTPAHVQLGYSERCPTCGGDLREVDSLMEYGALSEGDYFDYALMLRVITTLRIIVESDLIEKRDSKS